MKTFFKRTFRVTYLTVTLMIIAVHLLFLAADFNFVHNLEMRFYDLMFHLRGPKPPGPEVVIVAIDDESIKAIGRWPWSRREINRAVEVLHQAGAKVIGFDIIFAEKQEEAGAALLSRLQQEMARRQWSFPALEKWVRQEGRQVDPDGELAEKFGQCGNVVLGYYFQGLELLQAGPEYFSLEISPDNIKSSTYDLVRWTSAQSSPAFLLAARGVEINLPLLSGAACDSGYFNAIPDPDGSIRTLPLAITYRKDIYAPLSLSILQRFLDNPLLEITLSDQGVRGIRLGHRRIPVDDHGRFRIDFRGPAKTFPYYAFIDVVEGRIPPENFRDKIVLVGASAVGIYDIRVTPFASVFPGVEVHANIMDNILRQDFLWAPKGLWNPAVLSLIGLSLIMCWVQPRVRAWFGLALLINLIALYFLINYYLFSRHQIYLQMLYPLSGLFSVYVAVGYMRFMAEEKERKRIKAAFQNYVPPEVVNTMLQHPEKLHLGGEKREMTVIFSDIRGFTTLSEKMEPEVLVELLHSYLNPMTDIVFKHGGTMDKYIGDAIMAIYGAPLVLPDHARCACETALEMTAVLQQLWEGWRAQNLPELKIGIGINSGLMTVGNMGSQRLFDYTVIGDNVNLASRLEGLTKYYGTAILISESTQKLLPDGFIVREVDRVRVKGKRAPVSIFELRGQGRPEGVEAELLQTFQAGLVAFRQQRWKEAEQYLSACLRLDPEDGPATLLFQRTANLAQQPPAPDWDGTSTLTEK
ncbi:MAG: CHASE2 domain-containing protein [Deltaproteobacteria bacterium]|nr:CHASE2 domain-containing protein [Deltaproteobacteria bacterium]